MRVAIRVDGGGWRGMGHVARCGALAVELQHLGARVEFATRTPAMLERLARIAPTIRLVGPSDRDAIAAMKCDRIVIDLPYPAHVPDAYVVPRSHEGDWSKAILRREFRDYGGDRPMWARDDSQGKHTPRVYVSGGGTDHHGLLVPLLEAVGLMATEVEPVIADGSLEHVARTMAGCDLALISYGVTALECACVGLPAMYLCPTDGHAKGGAALEREGCGVNLGDRATFGEAGIARLADDLLANTQRLAAMSTAGRALIDGRGAERVAREILEG